MQTSNAQHTLPNLVYRGQAYGIELGTKMCRALLDSGVPGLHLYTLNLEAAPLAILENLGLINKAQARARPACAGLHLVPLFHANWTKERQCE